MADGRPRRSIIPPSRFRDAAPTSQGYTTKSHNNSSDFVVPFLAEVEDHDEPTSVTSLPDFVPAKDGSAVVWGNFVGNQLNGKLISIYEKIVSWKANFFKLPSGSVGKAFVVENKRLIDLWVNESNFESAALIAQNIFMPLMLQKPSPSSKNSDHIKYLKKRLEQWKNSSFDELLSECTAIQSRLIRNKRKPEHVERVFARLMLQGKVSAALRWVTDNSETSVHDITDDIIKVLNGKHPKAQPASNKHIIEGNVPKVEPVIFDNIDGNTISRAAKDTKGSHGPSGASSDLWRRVLCSKSFGKASEELCDSIARMARRLCTVFIDPSSVQVLVNCRLIPLDKNPGVRPIGIGEILRRIMGKAVTQFLKPEIAKSVGPLQLSAGHAGGCEAACHAMKQIFDAEDCEAVILVDATNAFNSLNRATALLNIRFLCPEFSVYLINTYRVPCKLFLPNGTVLHSEEGSTQGDNCAAGFYAISTFIMIKDLAAVIGCKQIWFADDGGAGGKVKAIREWWTRLNLIGPPVGYLPNPPKTIVVVKNDFYDETLSAFKGTGVHVTKDGPRSDDPSEEGHRYLGGALGTESFQRHYVEKKVEQWVQQLERLCKVAMQEPQLAYTAFTVCLSKRWMYIMRTVENSAQLFQPLEDCIRTKLLPVLTSNYQFSDIERRMYSLPTRFGGLGIINPVDLCAKEFEHSKQATAALVELIHEQNISVETEQYDNLIKQTKQAKTQVSEEKNEFYKAEFDLIRESSSPICQRMLDGLQYKGTSSWLTALPLDQYGFTLNKQEFTDSIRLRYGYPIPDMPKVCACSKENSVSHALTCQLGGYVHMRHNQVRDLEAHWLSLICKDVHTEPQLLPLTGENLAYKTANTSEEARSDIVARGVWSTMGKTFFDVRILNPEAASNQGDVKKVCAQHEASKKREYGERIIEVEKANFTPLVFTTTGVMGEEATRYHKKIATLMSIKRNTSYSDEINYMRQKLRFCILRSTLAAVRGFRGRKIVLEEDDNDINIIPAMPQCI